MLHYGAAAIRGLVAGAFVRSLAPQRNWTIVRRLIGAWARDRRQFSRARLPRFCPICGYRGVFISVGHPSR